MVYCTSMLISVQVPSLQNYFMDSSDLCEADDGKLATAHLRTSQLQPRFNEASHVAKTVSFLPVSLPNVKKLRPSLVNLAKCPVVDDSDFCEADGRLASHNPFPERHCFHPALAKLPTQRRRSSPLLLLS